MRLHSWPLEGVIYVLFIRDSKRNARNKLTRVLGVEVSVPWDQRIDERSRSLLVNKDWKVYDNLGPASASDVGR